MQLLCLWSEVDCLNTLHCKLLALTEYWSVIDVDRLESISSMFLPFRLFGCVLQSPSIEFLTLIKRICFVYTKDRKVICFFIDIIHHLLSNFSWFIFGEIIHRSYATAYLSSDSCGLTSMLQCCARIVSEGRILENGAYLSWADRA